ncbi:MAG: hypothetical protein IPG10_08490 [Flavobacteriales bacterium]|nr:hypothetical protein [Flavobacteriales bacterium]MBK7084593.1 hypothetical protein [Flavobacteriales bacterium]MBK9074237.1 hypothetical protein [Flavobacteriales bacterium]MBK9537773.1 hypothetical protein [Flavobacteriales bacterium]
MRGPWYLPVLAILTGCKSYTITPESLREQLTQAPTELVTTSGPYGYHRTYEAKSIHKIRCLDKNGTQVELTNGPAIETRITLSNGKRRAMYFDNLVLRNDTLIGRPSRFIPSLKFTMPFAEITKIEVQNGGKDFQYE